jgi:hypothetical protein
MESMTFRQIEKRYPAIVEEETTSLDGTRASLCRVLNFVDGNPNAKRI